MASGRYTPRTIGSKPTPRDAKTEQVRDTLKPSPFAKKYDAKKDEQR